MYFLRIIKASPSLSGLASVQNETFGVTFPTDLLYREKNWISSHQTPYAEWGLAHLLSDHSICRLIHGLFLHLAW